MQLQINGVIFCSQRMGPLRSLGRYWPNWNVYKKIWGCVFTWRGVYTPDNNALVRMDPSPSSWAHVELFSFVHMHWREIFHSDVICNSTVLIFTSSWYCDPVQRHPFKPNKNKLAKDFSQEIRETNTKVEALQKKKKKNRSLAKWVFLLHIDP